MGRKQRGFSLLESLAVVGVVLILSAIAIPFVNSAVRHYQLESSARSVSNALLVARYEAIRRNLLASTVYREVPAPPVYGIDVNGNSTVDAGEPVVPLSPNVRMTNVGAPPLTSMGPTYDCAPACPALPDNSPFQVSFSSRGTVMQQVGSGLQNYWIEATRVYVLFLRHTVSGQWAAVTVTPGARTRVWIWNGTAWVTM